MSGNDSRIYGQARIGGLVYHISGGYDSTKTSASFDFSGQVTLDKLEELIDLMLAEIDRLLAGICRRLKLIVTKNTLWVFFKWCPLRPLGGLGFSGNDT